MSEKGQYDLSFRDMDLIDYFRSLIVEISNLKKGNKQVGVGTAEPVQKTSGFDKDAWSEFYDDDSNLSALFQRTRDLRRHIEAIERKLNEI